MSVFGIVGGTGLEQLEGFIQLRSHQVDTPYGATSKTIEEGRLLDKPVFYLHRHGAAKQIAPHNINYRANMWALKSLGVSHVIACNAVGGIAEHMQTGSLVVPDQLIDYTWGRQHSVADGEGGGLLHIDFTQPYDGDLRAALIQAAQDIPICEHAVHGVTQGPRLETAAEIRRMEREGCDIVGMTGMPEAAIARELGMAYACVCMVVNAAAGKSSSPLSMAEIRSALDKHALVVPTLLGYVLSDSNLSRA